MTTINILRHGETSGGNIYRGITDQPLTQKGWLQMRNAIGDNSHWQQIISSPLLRCSDFASHISEQLNIPVSFNKKLQEIDFGDWEGLSAAQIYQRSPDELIRFWDNPEKYTPPNGERLLSLQTRVLETWNEIIAMGEDILVITHGGPIRVILCHENKTPIKEVLSLDVPLASFHNIKNTETCTE